MSDVANDTVAGEERCVQCAREGRDTSGDNFIRYADGHGHCFSCGYHESADGRGAVPDGEREAAAEPRAGSVSAPAGAAFEPIAARGLTLETVTKYGYLRGRDERGQFHAAPYTDQAGRVVAYKLRRENKNFAWVGNSKAGGLFGQHLWRESGRRIVITEGEIDAMSVAQAMGNRWPVVSVRNGAATARKDIAAQLQWLSSYEMVVLCFDSDDAGRKAASDCADLFEPGKVAIAALPMKDANEMLKAGKVQQLVNACWEAKVYRPDGVFEAIDLLDEVLTLPEEGLAYPWGCLNTKTHGQRADEIVVWTAGTGIGKSQFLREVVYDLHRTHGKKVGYIALEESRRHTALAQVSLALNKPLHIPTVRALTSDDEIRAVAANVLSGIYIYDHFGSVSLERLSPVIRYFAKGLGCEYIVLDHLSIMVSGQADQGDERKRIDAIMTQLATVCRELHVGLHVVSHLRKSDGTPFEEGAAISLNDLRGSSQIAALANLVIGLERNQQDEANSHVTRVRIVKNRFSGETGVTGFLRYSPATGRLTECEDPDGVAPSADGSVKPTGEF